MTAKDSNSTYRCWTNLVCVSFELGEVKTGRHHKLGKTIIPMLCLALSLSPVGPRRGGTAARSQFLGRPGRHEESLVEEG
ncbi:hypothetical protein Taro_004488 [Colocasia esculenta]|uniref:Uncharacterized protein n=1 Tax=Colocasia esculenta TaxID=4460 RepID=A0A843TRS1_COLES|nr:hypothetical protein [Colocasia esculenta]